MKGLKSNLQIAAKWLWSNRKKDIWWTPLVLAKENSDPTSPKLTAVEAISIFKVLEEKGLIFKVQQNGQTVYFLHEAKELEWEKFLSGSGDDEKEHPDPTTQSTGTKHHGSAAARASLSAGVVSSSVSTNESEENYRYEESFQPGWFGRIFGSTHRRESGGGQRRVARSNNVVIRWALFATATLVVAGGLLAAIFKHIGSSPGLIPSHLSNNRPNNTNATIISNVPQAVTATLETNLVVVVDSEIKTNRLNAIIKMLKHASDGKIVLQTSGKPANDGDESIRDIAEAKPALVVIHFHAFNGSDSERLVNFLSKVYKLSPKTKFLMYSVGFVAGGEQTLEELRKMHRGVVMDDLVYDDGFEYLKTLDTIYFPDNGTVDDVLKFRDEFQKKAFSLIEVR